jgi:hypothetical protein
MIGGACWPPPPARSPQDSGTPAGNDIRTIQELLEHRDVTTTMIVLNRGASAVRSPLDR